jgi:stage V sporulation protein G
MMNIRQVRIYPVDTSSLGGQTRAYAAITIDACLALQGLRVGEGAGGERFVAFPTQRRRTGRDDVLVVPDDAARREYLRTTVIDAFKQWTPKAPHTD